MPTKGSETDERCSTINDSLAMSESSVESKSTTDPTLPHKRKCTPCKSVTSCCHTFIRRYVVFLSKHAAEHPWVYIVGVSFLSILLLAVGLATNFQMVVDYDIIYAPKNSLPKLHMDWIKNESGFKPGAEPFSIMVHDEGRNVLAQGRHGVRQLFQVLDTFKNTPGYDQVCSESDYIVDNIDGTSTRTCRIISVTRHWNHDMTLFEGQEYSDQSVINTMSSKTYPGGESVIDLNMTLGNFEEVKHWYNRDRTLSSAQSYIQTILIPAVEGAKEFESAVIQNLRQLQQEWKTEAAKQRENGLDVTTMQLEFFTWISYSEEFESAIYQDLPLTLLVGVIMVGFTCFVFCRRNRIQSRCLLGVFSVYTITMSLACGYGLMFLIGKKLF